MPELKNTLYIFLYDGRKRCTSCPKEGEGEGGEREFGQCPKENNLFYMRCSLTLLIIMRSNDYERSGRRRRGRAKGKQQQAELSCLLPSCPAAAFLLPCLAQLIAWCTTTEAVRGQHQAPLGVEGRKRWVGLVELPSFLPSPLGLPCCRRWATFFVTPSCSL